MREIDVSLITEAVSRACISANKVLPDDLAELIKKSADTETDDVPKDIMCRLCDNLCAAKELDIPICQDTGMAVIFAKVGQDVHFVGGSFKDAVNAGVAKGYTEGYLRKSVVADPLRRINTGDNTPAVLHIELVEGDKVELTVAPKGFGSENMSALKMFTPSASREDIIDYVVDVVRRAGSNPCPPMVIGVGIGGDFEQCALLAKKALCRPVSEPNADEYYAAMESEILEKANALNIGPQGFGGKTILPGTGDSVGGTLRIQNWYWKDASQVQGNNYDGLGALAFADIEATDARYLEMADVEAGNYYQAYLYEFRVSDEDAAKLAEYGLTAEKVMTPVTAYQGITYDYNSALAITGTPTKAGEVEITVTLQIPLVRGFGARFPNNVHVGSPTATEVTRTFTLTIGE